MNFPDCKKELKNININEKVLRKEDSEYVKQLERLCIGDNEYINQLEQLVIFLADTYDETSRAAEKELIENNNDLYCKIPLIQGLKNQLDISKIASFKDCFKDSNGNIRYDFDLKSIVSNLKEKY